jgi:hypothetical protein
MRIRRNIIAPLILTVGAVATSAVVAGSVTPNGIGYCGSNKSARSAGRRRFPGRRGLLAFAVQRRKTHRNS